MGGTDETPFPGGAQNSTEEYNGVDWTAGENMTTARANVAGGGTQTAALVFGGSLGPSVPWKAETESYDGTDWSEVGDLNEGRKLLGGVSQGSQTAALAAGGYDGSAVASSEEYNGTGWTEGENLNTARSQLVGAGSQTAGLMFGGNPAMTNAEEYNGASWTAAEAM